MQDLTKLPLHEILLLNGYKLDRSKSSRLNPVLINPENNQKLVISKKGENYLYFNPNDNTDRGNILSFARIRNLNVKALIKNYDENIELAKEYRHNFFTTTATKDPNAILKEFQSFCTISQAELDDIPLFLQRSFDSRYLERFGDSFKKDEHNNIVIPHFKLANDEFGESYKDKLLYICGYTKRLNYPITKNKDGKELQTPIKSLQYGKKELEILNPSKSQSLEYIVISESIIDSISLGQLKNLEPQKTLFVSTSGTFSMEHIQRTLFALLDKTPKANVILAFDNDEMGHKYKESMEKVILEHTKRFPTIYKPFAKDCNDDLKIANITRLTNLHQETYQQWVNNRICKYKMAKSSSTRANFLHDLRKLHKIKPFSEENIQSFNTIRKDKRIKGF